MALNTYKSNGVTETQILESAEVSGAIADHNTDGAAQEDIREAIPSEADIEAIADGAVSAHNTDGAAHEDIREVIADIPGIPVLIVPDYSNQETVNRITANNGTWTVNRNGFVNLKVIAANITPAVFKINNVVVDDSGIQNNTGYNTKSSGIYAVAANDIIQISVTGSFVSCSCYFIPPKITPVSLTAPPVQIVAAKKYSFATTALKFKFKRPSGFNAGADGNSFYFVKARIKNLHSGAFFDLEVSWIPQTGNYDFCSIVKFNSPAGVFPSYFYLSNDSDGFYGWIPLATAADYHWKAQAEMWSSDNGNSAITGVYEPEITFETSDPSAGRTITTTIVGAS
jgi:hypothetical protein